MNASIIMGEFRLVQRLGALCVVDDLSNTRFGEVEDPQGASCLGHGLDALEVVGGRRTAGSATAAAWANRSSAIARAEPAVLNVWEPIG